jgi:transcription elongation factor Elf1
VGSYYQTNCPNCNKLMVVQRHKKSLHEYKGKCLHCNKKSKVSTLDQDIEPIKTEV